MRRLFWRLALRWNPVLVDDAGAHDMNANARKIDLDTSAYKAAAAEMRGIEPKIPVIVRETENAAAINRISTTHRSSSD